MTSRRKITLYCLVVLGAATTGAALLAWIYGYYIADDIFLQKVGLELFTIALIDLLFLPLLLHRLKRSKRLNKDES